MTKQLTSAVDSAKRALALVRHEGEAHIKRTDATQAAKRIEVELAQARLAEAGKQLGKCRVFAPHDGVVLQAPIPVREGSLMRQKQLVLVLRASDAKPAAREERLRDETSKGDEQCSACISPVWSSPFLGRPSRPFAAVPLHAESDRS